MRNLSLADREWLYRIHVDAAPRRFTDDIFLQACGVQTLGGGRSSDGISRLLRAVYISDGAWPQNLADERETELVESCFAKFMKGTQETRIENLLAAYENVVHEEISAPSAGDCGEPSHTARTADGKEIPLDGTVTLLQSSGVPVTAQNWMRAQFMGNPPTPPFDGELLAELPSWVRAAYEPEEEESAEPVCGLDDEDNEDEED